MVRSEIDERVVEKACGRDHHGHFRPHQSIAFRFLLLSYEFKTKPQNKLFVGKLRNQEQAFKA